MDAIDHDLTLPEAARRLRMSGDRCRRLVLCGRLEGRQVAGRWLVTAASVERIAQELAAESVSVAPAAESAPAA